uniref:Tol-Pal system protein TolQ n=1 Tax=Candidatus Aschnera chinzeii TaxID=1485666 RepID=A0AAT9G4A7_9ENTR|nr:MAG: Tol-Pal system protein TolQ [Candidatus Aschnera chinzeii]
MNEVKYFVHTINILDFFLKANYFVQLSILILMIFSIISWAIIIQRINVISYITRQNKHFETLYKLSLDLHEFYKKNYISLNNLIGLKKIFFEAFKVFTNIKNNSNYSYNDITKIVFKVMKITMEHEIEILEKNIFILALIGSVSPYIGLFGTIFGVIDTLFVFGNVSNHINIQIIAPGIAEALIITVIGLFTAIPAMIAFNIFNYKLNIITQSYSHFIEKCLIALYPIIIHANNK